MCDVVFRLINQHVAVPPLTARRRVWVRMSEQLRFASGLRMRVEMHRALSGEDLRLSWNFGVGKIAALTCYEPVSLISDCGQRVVIRAVALAAGKPIAVLAEVEGVECLPHASVEVAA